MFIIVLVGLMLHVHEGTRGLHVHEGWKNIFNILFLQLCYYPLATDA